jgi:hypothetical protein
MRIAGSHFISTSTAWRPTINVLHVSACGFRNQVRDFVMRTTRSPDCSGRAGAERRAGAPVIMDLSPPLVSPAARQMDAAPHEYFIHGRKPLTNRVIPTLEYYGVHGDAGTGAERVSTVHLAHLHPSSSRRGHHWPYRRRPSNPVEAMLIWRVITTATSRVPPSLHSRGSNVAAGAS